MIIKIITKRETTASRIIKNFHFFGINPTATQSKNKSHCEVNNPKHPQKKYPISNIKKVLSVLFKSSLFLPLVRTRKRSSLLGLNKLPNSYKSAIIANE